MRFSSLVDRIGGVRSTAWDIHAEAVSARARGEDVIVLSVGDPDLDTAAPIVEAAVAALRAGDTHYTAIPGQPALRKAIAGEHRRRTGQAVGPDQVVVLAGAQNALFAASLCLFETGDEVVVPEPMYLTYEACIRAAGASIVTVPQHRAAGFRLDPTTLEEAITPRTRAIFLAMPCNPTGVVMNEHEMAAVAWLARQHDLWVVADEVYAALTFEAPHRAISGLPAMAERTVTIGSLSKSHAMTGWRMGWMIGPRMLIQHAERLALCMLYGLPGFVQAGALAALEASGDAGTGEADPAEAMRRIFRRRRDLVLERLSDVAGLHCFRPEAGMFMLIDVSGSGLGSAEFVRRLYAEAGVSLLDAGLFGPSAEGCVRLAFAVGETRLIEACTRIATFTAGLLRNRK